MKRADHTAAKQQIESVRTALDQMDADASARPMNVKQRIELKRRLVELRDQMSKTERELSQVVIDEDVIMPFVSAVPAVSAAALSYTSYVTPVAAPSVPIAPVPPLRVGRTLETIPARLTPADFPRAPNAQQPATAGVGTQAVAEHIKSVTSADAVRDGTYAQNREQLLRMAGQQAQRQHAFAPSGLLALNPQQLAPVASHPLFAGQAPGRAPQGAVIQPHGNPMTGPPSALLLAKRERARAARGRG